MGNTTSDFLIIGGGIMGVCIALELQRRYPGARVTLIEKEPALGEHASGRNSGVLHAGLYYAADSLKARFTREGNELLTAYCLERGLPINRCGKLVVATSESSLRGLDRLLERGRGNGVELHPVSEAQALRLEPRARTVRRALYSPTTSSVDPEQVLHSLASDAEGCGVRILRDTAYRGRKRGRVLTSRNDMDAGYVVNAAGLHADSVARDFGFSRNHRILPFKGLYLYSSEPRGSLGMHVYPVPDLANPFLGVHFTVTVRGEVKIGPTAAPAFWRENYGGLSNFRAGELAHTLALQSGLLLRGGFGFAALALREMAKQFPAVMVRQASRLVRGLDGRNFRRWGRAGIRAQPVDMRTRSLVMDFLYEGDERSFHLLNAVSPGFTCCLPFSRHIADEIEARIA
jgi:L-2-hydroxyglutarate oxidase LhgO